MEQQGKRPRLETLAVWVAGLCGLGALALVSVLAILYRCAPATIYEEKLLINPDQLVRPLLYALLLGIVCMAVAFLFLSKSAKGSRQLWILTGLVCVWLAVMGSLWLLQASHVPYFDQDFTCKGAAALIEGDYAFLDQEYFWVWPHQYGLIFVFEGIFRLAGSTEPQVIGFVNLVCLVLVVLFGRLLADELFQSEAVSACWLVLAAGCLPLLFLAPFAYGEYLSWAELFAALWCTVKVYKGGRWMWGVGAGLLMAFAVTVRRNSLIFGVAILILLAVRALTGRGTRRGCLLAGALVLAAMLAMPSIINQVYTLRTGQKVHKGSPMVSYLQMGLSDDEKRGPGWYNGYNYNVYRDADYDDEAAGAQVKQDVTQLIREKLAHKGIAAKFFWRKLATTWAEPSYQALSEIESHDVNKGRTGIAELVYSNTAVYDGVYKYMNAYQELVYLGALAGVGWLILGPRRRKTSVLLLLPLTVFLGGFLFHLVWETKSRYVLTYLPMLMLYAAFALGGATLWLRPRAAALTGRLKAALGKKRAL